LVVISSVYTKTGDQGTTSLGDGSRTSKNDARLEAFSTVDEANSSIGVALSMDIDADVKEVLLRIQNDMFDVGADLCTPVIDDPKYPPLRVTEEQVTRLENLIDHYNEPLSTLRTFVLPSGTPLAAQLHVARTVVRRAERQTWNAIHAFGEGVNITTAKYLNRLSDLLFVLSRHANREIGDVLWVPGANRVLPQLCLLVCG
jgi:cob(I)alamin adenosyltransferase